MDTAIQKLEYCPYYSSICAWPGIENCEFCTNPSYYLAVNHSVIVYKIYNNNVYLKNIWEKSGKLMLME